MFTLTDKQVMEVNKFHNICRIKKEHGAIGGVLTYEFTPTGIGTVIKITCNLCNSTKDITDYDSW